jgi:hypothetical protein
MLCEYVLYYDTQTDVDRCREGHTIWKENRAGRENLLWVKDLRDEPAVRAEHPDAPLPILKMIAMPFVGWFGEEALAKMRELYGITTGVPQAVMMPPSMTVRDPAPMVARVKARYVLYTNDISAEIKVPANGVVNVQSFDLISTTLGDKLPKWLRQYRSLPVLATLEEAPTVWYGQAARDYCIILSGYNGGLMLL